MRPWRSSAAATSLTRSTSSPPSSASAAASATAKLRRRYGAAVGSSTAGARSRTSTNFALRAPRRFAAASSRTSAASGPITRVDCGLQHGELLARDLELGIAKELGVLEADGGQHRDPRGEDVGRVEAAAEPGLDHSHLDPRGGEGDERGAPCRPRTASPTRPRRASGRPTRPPGRRARPRPRTPPARSRRRGSAMRSRQRSSCGER